MPILATEHVPIPTLDLVSWIFDDPKYNIDKPIYIDAANPKRTISAREAKILVQKLAAGLQKAGLRNGDCVCIHSFNDVYYPIAFLGIVAAGGIFAGTNPAYTSHELSHAIGTADIKYLIAEPDLLKTAITAAKENNIPASHIFSFDVHNFNNGDDSTIPSPSTPTNVRSWQWLFNQGTTTWPRFNNLQQCSTTPAARLFSSGTTGLPKALNITHHNLIAQHTLVLEHGSHHRDYEPRRLLCTPMFHVSIVPRAHTSALRSGVVTVVMRRFALDPWLDALGKFEISDLNLVPPMVHTVLAYANSSQQARTRVEKSMRAVRNAWCGAAPLSREGQASFKELLSTGAPFNQVWGMSETTCIATMVRYPEHDDSGSVGRLLPNLDAKLVDDDGNEVSGKEMRGELCVRGPIIVRGYYKNEDETRRSWDADKYFHTGDIAHLNDKGLWYIVDRKKELIKVRGFQVAPAELEGVLLSHDEIIDAAVIGIPLLDEGTELPRAYVVARPKSPITAQALHEFMRQRLARYKQLEGGIVFVDLIPKNPSGKILKKILRERAKKELGVKL